MLALLAFQLFCHRELRDKMTIRLYHMPLELLTDPEKKYSQTEKEVLAMVWSVEHFHVFLYGDKFSLITEHKPLEVISGKRTAEASARIERWILRS